MSAVDALKRVRPYLQAMAALDRSLGKPDAEVLNLMSVVDQAIAHPEPVSEYDFTNVIHLTHHKVQHIIERDGFVLTGFVLTKNKEGRHYSKCIVDMSAVRWFYDGMTFFRMMHAPTPKEWLHAPGEDSVNTRRASEYSEPVKQEPVAWVNTRYNMAFVPPEGFNVYECDAYKAGELKPAFFSEEMQPVKQEPVAKVTDVFPTRVEWLREVAVNSLLYAAPVSAKREWVDLTDDELLNELKVLDASTARLPIGFKLFARAVIAAFKEKNSC